MRINGTVNYEDGSTSINFKLPVASDFPAPAHQSGEFWILAPVNNEGRVGGLYWYDSSISDWRLLQNQGAGGANTITGDTGAATFTVARIQTSDTNVVVDAGGDVAQINTRAPKIQVRTTTVLNLNTSTEVSIPWQVRTFYDNDIFTHNTVTNNTLITVNKAGHLKLVYNLNYEITSTNKIAALRTYAKVNNTIYNESTSYSWIDQGEILRGTNQADIYVPVAAGDTVSLWSIRYGGDNVVVNIVPAESTFHLTFFEN